MNLVIISCNETVWLVSRRWHEKHQLKKRFQIIYLTSYFVMTSRYFTINPRITRYSNFKRKQKNCVVIGRRSALYKVVEILRATRCRGEFWWRKGWNSKCISRGPFDGKTVISFFFSRKEMPKIGSDRECNERSLEINVLLSFLFFSLSSSSSILVSRSAKNEIWSVYKVIDIVYRYAIDIKGGKVLKNRFCKNTKMKSTLIKTTKRVRVR